MKSKRLSALLATVALSMSSGVAFAEDVKIGVLKDGQLVRLIHGCRQ